MELASMLAGETFTDHPRSVSGPIGAFLRRYNDKIDDKRRQDLYAYAAKVVGTAGSPSVEHARAERLVQWASERWKRRARWSPLARLELCDDEVSRQMDWESAAVYAIHSIRRLSDDTHAGSLALIDELIDITAYHPRVPAVGGREAPTSNALTQRRRR